MAKNNTCVKKISPDLHTRFVRFFCLNNTQEDTYIRYRHISDDGTIWLVLDYGMQDIQIQPESTIY